MVLQDHMETARMQIASAWCAEKNKHKAMDLDLAEACAMILVGWIDTAAQHLRNEEYYRDLIDQCAKHIGPIAYTADDGVVHDSPIRAKVPELVAMIVGQIGEHP